MTSHLEPDDFVAALERAPEDRVAAHLAACATCRDELAALRAPWDALAGVDVPEPSPLFWDHFSARVRQATADAAPVESWWSMRRVVWVMGAAAAALLLTVGLMWRPVPEAEVTLAEATPGEVAAEAPGEVPVVFDDVAGLFETMPDDEVEAFAPAGTATWAMVDDLTDDERAAFVRLLEQQLAHQAEALP